jgi:hypothetical protein
VLTILERSSKASVQPSDVGLVEEAVRALATLEVSGAGACKQALQNASRLVADALRDGGFEVMALVDESLPINVTFPFKVFDPMNLMRL